MLVLDDSIGNPQLRVETQVYVLVNDNNALDFTAVNRALDKKGGYQQALNIPNQYRVQRYSMQVQQRAQVTMKKGLLFK